MDDYTALRQFADSWGLVLLIGIFLAAVAVAFRPGSRARYEKAARIPLRDNEDE